MSSMLKDVNTALAVLYQASCPICGESDYLQYIETSTKSYFLTLGQDDVGTYLRLGAMDQDTYDHHYVCKHCLGVIYDWGARKWCAEVEKTLKIDSEGIQRTWEQLELAADDYSFLGADWWFVQLHHERLLNDYISVLRLLGQYNGFPPLPAYLL